MSDVERDPDKEKAPPVVEDLPEDDDFPAHGSPEDGDLPQDDDFPAEGSSLDDVDVRDLLRGALRPPPGSVAPELLHGVQRKLRQRSRGKFYGDGWSTAASPKSTYLVTSALMLVLIIIVAVLLIPWEAVTR